jgi:hypothetical protein
MTLSIGIVSGGVEKEERKRVYPREKKTERRRCK